MKTTVWQISDDVVFVAIRPPLKKEEIKNLQLRILEYIREIGKFVLAGKIGQRKGISYFRITTLFSWPGLKKAVEIGLEKGLTELNKI